MTNEEILANRRNVYAAELGGNTNVIPLCEIEELLDLARADERAKLSKGGVRVFVSSEEHHAKLFVGGEKPNNMLGMYFAKSGDEQQSICGVTNDS